MLEKVVDAARVLTGARYGLIATTGDNRRVEELVTSGFAADSKPPENGPSSFT